MIVLCSYFFFTIHKTPTSLKKKPNIDNLSNSPVSINRNGKILNWENLNIYSATRLFKRGNNTEPTVKHDQGCPNETLNALKIKNAESTRFQEVLKYTWVATKGNDINSKLNEFGEFLTSKRQNVTTQKSMNIEAFANYTPLYEGESLFFQKVQSLKKAKLYFLPWTHTIQEWLCMDFNAKQNIVNGFLPVKEYHPMFLSDQFVAKFSSDRNVSISIIPEAVPLRSHPGVFKRRVNTFFFGYHVMTPHKPKFYIYPALSGGWNITKDCIGQKCNRFPDMLTFMIVLEADKYRINVGSQGRIHIPDTEQRLVMSCCYANYTKPKYPNKKHIFVNTLFDMTQTKVKATHHGLAESLIKLTLFAPFLRQNPDIHLHFTPNRYTKGLIPIVTEMLNLKNPFLFHGIDEIEANTVYVPPGMHCLRGGDLMSVQLTSHFFRQWTENTFKGNTTQDMVIILKRSSRHLHNYDDVYRIVESKVKETHGELQLYEFYDKNLPTVNVTMQLFYRAQAIIGVHGAGLTNMIFARPGTHLLEIMCPSKLPLYRIMAYKLGLYYYTSVSLTGKFCYGKGPLGNVTEIEEFISVIFENIRRRLTKQ